MAQIIEPKKLSTLEVLEWYDEMGVDETIGEEPQNRFLEVPQEEKPVVSEPSKPQIASPTIHNIISPDQNILMAEELANKAKTIKELEETLLTFDGLALKNTAHSTVFADGSPKSNLMIITDSPNPDEDREGKPFVGEVGELFNKMFQAIHKTRESDFYIATLLPWRVLGNRKPNQTEISTCLPFLKRHIELVSPDILILLGSTVAQALLSSNDGINKLRGKWQTITLGEQTFNALPTFHPSYLIKQPNAKRKAWQDLLEINKKLKTFVK